MACHDEHREYYETMAKVVAKSANVRQFATGATRDQSDTKLDFEGFLSPLALGRFAEYMHRCRRMSDGTTRASDNWQKGIPVVEYLKSAFRHFFTVWRAHRLGYPLPQDELCALLFNVQGLLHEIIKKELDQNPGNK